MESYWDRLPKDIQKIIILYKVEFEAREKFEEIVNELRWYPVCYAQEGTIFRVIEIFCALDENKQDNYTIYSTDIYRNYFHTGSLRRVAFPYY